MAEDSKDEIIESLEEKVIHLSRMLVKSFGYAGQDPDTFLQNARRTTEAICRFLYVKEIGEPKSRMMLNDYGRELASKKVIPDRIGILVGTIQTYGNYAAHAQEDLSETTREWIAPCQTALASLTNWFFLEYLKGEIPNELASTIKGFSDKDAQGSKYSPEGSSNSRNRLLLLGGMLLLSIMVALYIYLKPSSTDSNTTLDKVAIESQQQLQEDAVNKLNKAEPNPNAKRLAIIYFDSPEDNNELSRLRTGLADMLISDLSKVNMLNVVERNRLEEILKEQKLNNSNQFDASTATLVGKLLGVEYILMGSFFEILGKLRIDARIIQVETGKIMKSEGVDGETSAFFSLEKNLVQNIITDLDVDLPSPLSANARNTGSISYEVSLQYSDGLVAYDKGNTRQAVETFELVLKQYPDFVPAREMVQKIKNQPK